MEEQQSVVSNKAAQLRAKILKALNTPIEVKFSFSSLQDQLRAVINKIRQQPIELKFSIESLRQKIETTLKERPFEITFKVDKLTKSVSSLEQAFSKSIKDRIKIDTKPLQKTLDETKKVYENFNKRIGDKLDDIQSFFRNDLGNKLKPNSNLASIASKTLGIGSTAFGGLLGYLAFTQNLYSAQTLYESIGSIINVGNRVNKGLEYLSFSGVDMTPYNVAQLLTNPFSYINPINPQTTAGIYLAAQQYADTEYQLARVKTILPKNQWEANARNISAIQNKLQYSVSTPDILALQYEVLSAGFTKAEDSAKITEAALKLTKAGFADAAETARLLVTTMQAYNQSAEEASSTAAKLQGIVQQGITTVPELANVFGQLASVASQAGVAIEDVGAALAVLTQKGQPTAVASTSIQSLIIRTLNMAPEAEKALKRYSAAAGKAIQINPATIRQQGFTEVLKQIGEITEFDPEKLREIFPEIQAYRAAIALLADRGKKLSTIRQDIGQSSAAFLEDQFQISLGNQKEQFIKFINTSRALLEDLGKEAVPVLNDFVASAQKVLNAVKQMPEPVKQVLGTLIKTNLVLSATTDMFSSIFDIVKNLATTLAGGALFGLVFRHIGDPTVLLKKVTESAKLGFGTSVRTVAQEAFGLDSSYSILMDKLIKQGYDRAQAERAISDALKDRQNTVQSLLKDEQILMQYADKVKTSSRISQQTQSAFTRVFGKETPIRVYETMQNLYATETRREKRVQQRLARIQEQKARLIQQSETVAPSRLGRLLRDIDDLSAKERRLTEALPDARKKRYLRFALDTVQLAERRSVLSQDREALTREVASKFKVSLQDVTDEMRRRYLAQLDSVVESRSAFLRGERNNELAQSMKQQIKESLREVGRELKQVTRERDVAIRSKDAQMATALQARREELLAKRAALREELSFYSSSPKKELQKMTMDAKGLGKSTIFTPEGLISGAATLGSIAYFLSNTPTLSNLNKASTADIANLVVSGLFAGGTTLQFFKDYKENLIGVRDALFSPMQSGKTLATGLVRGVGAVGNTLNRLTGAEKYLDAAAGAMPFLQNNTARGLVGLGGIALLGALAGATVGNAFNKFQEYQQSNDRFNTASMAVTEVMTSWKSMQEKVSEMLNKNSEAVDKNTKATTELTAEIRRLLLPEEEQQVLASTVEELKNLLGKSEPMDDEKFNKVVGRLSEYGGEDLVSIIVGRPTNRMFRGLDASLATSVGVFPEEISAAMEAASKDPKKYQAFKAAMFNIAAGWSDTQTFASKLADYDKKLQDLNKVNPDNVFAYISPDNPDEVRQKLARGEQLSPEVIEEVTKQRRNQAGKIEAYKASLVQEAEIIKTKLDEAIKKKDSATAAVLTALFAEYKTKLQQFDDLEKKFKGAKEFGQEQLEGYNQFARNIQLKKESGGNLTAMARQFAVQELMGYAEGRAKIQKEAQEGTVQGNFMQMLKDNLVQEFESVLQSVDEGVLSLDYAISKLKEVANYEVSLNGQQVSPFTPRERLQIEQKLLEVQKKKLQLENEYYSNLVQISEILQQIDLSKTIEYFKTLSDYLSVFMQKVGNTSEAVRASVERLKGVTDSFAAAPLESASMYYDAFARQAKNFSEMTGLDLQLAQEKSNFLRQSTELETQRMQTITDADKLDLEIKQKYSRREAEAKSLDEKLKEAQSIKDAKKKEKAMKEVEEAKKNLASLDTELKQDKAKLDLMKAQADQLANQQALLENQYKVRSMLIDIQKESLKIEQQFIDKELEIERQIIERKRVLGEAQWNRDTLISWIDKMKAGKSEFIQAKMENVQATFEDKFLDKKYQIEQQVYDLMVKQYELAVKRQKVEMNIMAIKLKTEKLKAQKDLSELQSEARKDKKAKEKYEVTQELIKAIDTQLEQIKVNEKRLNETEVMMKEGFAYQKSIMRQNYEDAKLQIALRRSISSVEASPERQTAFRLNAFSDLLSQLTNAINSVKDAVSSRYSAVSSLVSQFYPAFSRDQIIKKQVMEARLELQQKEQEYKFNKLAIELKSKELDIAYKLKEIELSTAEAKLKAEMAILNAKKEQAALNGATAEELKAYEDALSAMREQAGLFEEQKSFMRGMLAVQKFTNTLEKENMTLTNENEMAIAKAKYERAVNAADSGILAANRTFRSDVMKIVENNLNSLPKTTSMYDKLKALVDSLGVASPNNPPPLANLADTLVRATQQASQPKTISVGMQTTTNADTDNVLNKILSELVSFHKDFLALSNKGQAPDALTQVTSALRQANSLR